MGNKVAVLFGGQSSEHPVSLMSAASVLANLDEKYERYLVGITKDGRWYHFNGSIEEIENDSWENNENNQEVILSPNANHHGFFNMATGQIDYVDVILPILHGRFGEDGTLQGLCELNGIKLVSCNMTSSALAMDKEFTHIVCQNIGIPMAKYLVYHKNHHPEMEVMFENVKQQLGLPCYVKPTKEGSSFGAHKIKNYEDFLMYVQDAFSYDDKILLEEFIDGLEVGCGVLGEDETGEIYEVVVETEMYGYAEKYDGYKTRINVPATCLSSKQIEDIKRMSLMIYHALDCDVMARVDFFNSSKGLIFNEANLIPGFTSHSLYPAMFRAAGLSYKDLLTKMIELVKEK